MKHKNSMTVLSEDIMNSGLAAILRVGQLSLDLNHMHGCLFVPP